MAVTSVAAPDYKIVGREADIDITVCCFTALEARWPLRVGRPAWVRCVTDSSRRKVRDFPRGSSSYRDGAFVIQVVVEGNHVHRLEILKTPCTDFVASAHCHMAPLGSRKATPPEARLIDHVRLVLRSSNTRAICSAQGRSATATRSFSESAGRTRLMTR